MTKRRVAILIGSSRFPDESRLSVLRCPENDVEGMRDVLEQPRLGAFDEVHVMKNLPSHRIRRTMNRVFREGHPGDLILVYYSGHGKLNAAGRLCLAANDTIFEELEETSITVEAIQQFMEISAVKKTILLLDCCYSGAAGGTFTRSGVDDQLQLMSKSRGIYLVTASTAVQVAQEKETDDFGVFTKHVITGIKSGQADLNRDGLITMDELYEYVSRHVQDENFQKPMKWSIDVQGSLVIARSGRRAPGGEAAAQPTDQVPDLPRPLVALDEAGRLFEEVRCVGCGANLCGAPPDGACTVCSTEVTRSTRFLLRHCDPDWLDHIQKGWSWILASLTTAVLFGVWSYSVAMTTPGGFIHTVAASVVVGVVVAGVGVANFIAVRMLTAPERIGVERTFTGRIACFGMAAKIVHGLLSVCAAALVIHGVQHPANSNSSADPSPVNLVLASAVLVLLTVVTAGYLAILSHVRTLALRVPLPTLATATLRFMWSYAIVSAVIVLFGVASLSSDTPGSMEVPSTEMVALGVGNCAGMSGLAICAVAGIWLLYRYRRVLRQASVKARENRVMAEQGLLHDR